ncbi:MAG: AmmeMemoRadiSam system protein A [Planctomycetota bacterium]
MQLARPGPILPLHQAADAAVSAALRDPRFAPVRADELDSITIEISVLSRLVRIAGCEEIVVGRDGLVVASGDRRGTLLPQVATDHGYDAPAFLERTLLKAGLDPDAIARGEPVEIHRYEAQVLDEDAENVRRRRGGA